jgi:hypothetical protein
MNWRVVARVALLSAAVAFAIAQRKNLREQRARNEVLQSEVWRQTASVRAAALIPNETNSASVAEAEAATRELPGLRNDVRQLRERKAGLERLRVEHNRLKQQLSEVAARPNVSEPKPEQGFLMNASWAHAGFQSPEATLQSFFCAIRDKSIPILLACLTPESAEGAKEPEARIMKELQVMGQVKGYRVTGLEPYGADEAVTAKLQAAVNGITLDLHLRRNGTEWKIDLR